MTLLETDLAYPGQIIREDLFWAGHTTKEPDSCELRDQMFSALLTDLTIVVVEDHDDARRYLRIFLDRLGAKVMVARNGFEGLDAIKSNHPNMVLSDIAMPGMDGFELLRQIRALDAAPSARVPVVAMSAFFTDADRAQVLYAGFKACLPKPFSPEKLVETILTVLHD
jgi:CheY-like chemotaxis protein